MCQSSKKEFFKKFLYEPLPVEVSCYFLFISTSFVFTICLSFSLSVLLSVCLYFLFVFTFCFSILYICLYSLIDSTFCLSLIFVCLYFLFVCTFCLFVLSVCLYFLFNFVCFLCYRVTWITVFMITSMQRWWQRPLRTSRMLWTILHGPSCTEGWPKTPITTTCKVKDSIKLNFLTRKSMS